MNLHVGSLFISVPANVQPVRLARFATIRTRRWLDLRLVPVSLQSKENAFLDELIVLFFGEGNQHSG